MTVKILPDGRYILRNSQTDQDTEPMTRSETLRYIYESELFRFQQKFIETFMSFPYKWGIGGCKFSTENKEGMDAFCKWLMSVTDDAEVAAKFEECLAAIKEDSKP